MFEFLKMNIGKSDKQEVDVTICYYHLDENKDRYVFYFYDPTEKSPIYKWAYYLIDENYKDLRKNFNAVLKEKNYKPNKNVRLCMCNKTTKINTLRLPKTLKYSMNYKSNRRKAFPHTSGTLPRPNSRKARKPHPGFLYNTTREAACPSC